MKPDLSNAAKLAGLSSDAWAIIKMEIANQINAGIKKQAEAVNSTQLPLIEVATTASEIRAYICDNYASLKAIFGNDYASLDEWRGCLRRRMELVPADLELANKGHQGSNVTKFEDQVARALERWPQDGSCPFERMPGRSKRPLYRFKHP